MYRKDRAASSGGVLIDIKDELNCEDAHSRRRPAMDSDCVFILAKVKLPVSMFPLPP